MNEANLTRFGPNLFEGVSATVSTFRALDGAGKLILWNAGIQNAQIKTLLQKPGKKRLLG